MPGRLPPGSTTSRCTFLAQARQRIPNAAAVYSAFFSSYDRYSVEVEEAEEEGAAAAMTPKPMDSAVGQISRVNGLDAR